MRHGPRWSIGKTILTAGLIAGTIDITDAIVVTHLRGGSPMRMLRFIASGVLGPDAVQAGGGTSAFGLLCHYCIATSWSMWYVLASTKVAMLTRRPVICGLIYGVFIWAAMQYVVLPLSRVKMGAPPQFNWLLLNAVGILAVGVGMTIALVTARGRGDHS